MGAQTSFLDLDPIEGFECSYHNSVTAAPKAQWGDDGLSQEEAQDCYQRIEAMHNTLECCLVEDPPGQCSSLDW